MTRFEEIGIDRQKASRSVSEAKMLRCGDAYLGPKTVAHCIHDGKEAAYAIISSFRR